MSEFSNITVLENVDILVSLDRSHPACIETVPAIFSRDFFKSMIVSSLSEYLKRMEKDQQQLSTMHGLNGILEVLPIRYFASPTEQRETFSTPHYV